jgi:hypothetical protein
MVGSATAPSCTRPQVKQRQQRRRQSESEAIQAARGKPGQKQPLPTSSARRHPGLRLAFRRRVTHATTTRSVNRPALGTEAHRPTRGYETIKYAQTLGVTAVNGGCDSRPSHRDASLGSCRGADGQADTVDPARDGPPHPGHRSHWTATGVRSWVRGAHVTSTVPLLAGVHVCYHWFVTTGDR